MGMTKTEARELKPVVNRKFNALTEELDIRYRELRSMLEDQARIEYERVREGYIERLRDLFGESFQQTVEELQDLIKIAEIEGIKIKSWGLPVNIDNLQRDVSTMVSINTSKVTKKLQDDLYNKYGRARQELHRQKDDLLDNLTLLTVETEDAKKFLTSLPTVDSFLPEISEGEIVALLNE